MKTYMIFDVTELDKVDFTKVLETSADTVRKSNDGLKTFVKWEGDTPDFLDTLTTKAGPYTHDELITILQTQGTTGWYSPMDVIDGYDKIQCLTYLINNSIIEV